MEVITIFKAWDGKRFNTQAECERYEDVIYQVRVIEGRLRPRPSDIKFANGGGYVLQNISTVEKARQDFNDLVQRLTGKSGPAMRYYIEDMPAVVSFWDRLYSTDSLGREWGQLYYALNPGTGVDKEF